MLHYLISVISKTKKMKKTYNFKVLTLQLLVIFIFANYALTAQVKVSEYPSKDSFPLVSSKEVAQILIDSMDAKVVQIAANLLADDIFKVTGQRPEVIFSLDDIRSENIIISGTIGKSSTIDKLIKLGEIDILSIKTKWEASVVRTTNKEPYGIKKAVVVAGSDRRGTAYGLMDLSKAIGVSPWVWWADVMPEKKKELYLKQGTHIEDGPSVKYRGIFINDEDWSLTPWIAKTFDPETGNIGPKTYTKVFELMLRLKSNYFWPAMHECSLPFNAFTENAQIADDYAIIMGASHCEPLLRNNVTEWAVDGREKWQWDYFKHPDLIKNYWENILATRGKFENLYTVGMRGIHDGAMPGSKVRSERVDMMEKIFEDQRNLIEKYSSKKAQDIPMIFCPYKEVLDDYDAGMNVPEDITICWAEDNQGYVRRMPNKKERARSGGNGIYYHISYWSDYLWQVSIAPQLIAHQLGRAYDFEMKKLWVVNVGDIKAAERETQFFMDLSWDIDRWRDGKANQWVIDWSSDTFGKKFGKEIGSILNEYYRLAWRGKPEHIGHTIYNEVESKQRIKEYNVIAQKGEVLRAKLPKRLETAYFHLVYYPVAAVAAQNEKILSARRSALEKERDQANKSNKSFEQAELAFEKIKLMTEEYNQLGDGKWNHIMNYKPRNLKVLRKPILGSGLVADVDAKHIPHATTKQDFEDLMLNPDAILTLKDTYEIIKGDGRTNIVIEEGLSVDSYGAYLMPHQAEGYISIDKAPILQFKVNLKPGAYRARVKFLPSRPTSKKHKMRCAFSFDDGEYVVKNVQESKETFHNHHSCTWTTTIVSEACLDGYISKDYELKSNGETTIQIKILDTGMVFHRIEIFKESD